MQLHLESVVLEMDQIIPDMQWNLQGCICQCWKDYEQSGSELGLTTYKGRALNPVLFIPIQLWILFSGSGSQAISGIAQGLVLVLWSEITPGKDLGGQCMVPKLSPGPFHVRQASNLLYYLSSPCNSLFLHIKYFSIPWKQIYPFLKKAVDIKFVPVKYYIKMLLLMVYIHQKNVS